MDGNELARIHRVDPNVCHDQARIRGTRVIVSVVLDNLAAGVSQDLIPRSYPSLGRESIQEAIACAAELAGERNVNLTAKTMLEVRIG